jgi:hypothetical protein
MTSGTHDPARIAVLGGALVLLLASGWFVLSWRVAHNPAGDAFDEALGVAFAVLIVVSIVRGVMRRNRAGSDPNGDSGEAGERKGGSGG